MNYNWGEPKKNSKLTAIMMTKAEASRKKRLSSVKSTLSNQLHAGVESKLRKKKSPESARREASEFDPEQGLVEHNNNHLEAAYDAAEVAHLKLANGNNDFVSPEESSASSSHSSSTPIFREFSLNAAAEGLFHPASTIEAFIEHDAKYKSKMGGKNKPSSGRSSLSSRSGSRSSTVGEYLPSLENQKLPVVLNEKGGRVKQDPTASSSSAMRMDSPGRSSSRMSSTRSDSDLHAPRRLGAVPSSADRNALDFYDHDGDGTDDDRSDNDHLSIDACRAKSSPPDLGTFALSSSLAANKLGSSKSVGTLSEPPRHPQDDASLTKKFEDLKRLMNSKKKLPATTPSSQSQAKANHEEQSSRIKITSKNRDSSTSSTAKSAGDKAAASTAKAAKNVVVKTPPIKSKKDMAIRNGISLSDLKEEHRAALEMLKELGGPMDTDYDRDSAVEERVATRTKVARSSRSTKPKDDTEKSTAAAHSRSLKSSSAALTGKERSLEDVEEVDEEDDREDISETQQVASEDNLWKQYDDDENGAEDDDEEDEEEEEEEEDERFESETSGGSAPATARSVDLYGDEGFESEW